RVCPCVQDGPRRHRVEEEEFTLPYLAGSRIEPSPSSIAGQRDATTISPRSRSNSSGSRSMSFSYATPSSIAAKKETAVIPIVFAAAGDPVGSGLVAFSATGRQYHRLAHDWNHICRH